MSKKIRFHIDSMMRELQRVKKEKNWNYLTEYTLYDEILENSCYSATYHRSKKPKEELKKDE